MHSSRFEAKMFDGSKIAPAFPVDEFEARIERTRRGLAARGLHAGCFFAAETIYYLSGYEFPTHGAYQLLVVPLDQPPFLVMRQHMVSGVHATSWIADCVAFPDTGDPVEMTRNAMLDRKLAKSRVGLEEGAFGLTFATARALKDALPDVQFGDCSGIVEQLRMVKSPREIEYMRRAARISDVGIAAARSIVRAGVSERDIAIEVTRKMMEAGGEYQAMPVLVGIEENSRLATPIWSSRELASGELLWVEVFGTVRRYAAGLKASFGAAPASRDAERRMEAAKRAWHHAVTAIRPGRPASVVPEAVHEVFREAGFGETPHHQSGYSIGIAFAPNAHEARILGLRRGNTTLLQAGMTLFPIANLYGPGATVSASGMVVVTEVGSETLTQFRPDPADLSK